MYSHPGATLVAQSACADLEGDRVGPDPPPEK